MNLVKCEEPEAEMYSAELCPKCNRTMRSNGKGYWYCSTCGKWWREADVLPTEKKCIDGGEHELLLPALVCDKCGCWWDEADDFHIPTCHKEPI